MNTITSLLEKINTAKALDFGNILSESIELFKKTWLQGFLFQLFTMIIMLPLIIVLYIPLIGFIIAQAEGGYNDPEDFNAFFAGGVIGLAGCTFQLYNTIRMRTYSEGFIH